MEIFKVFGKQNLDFIGKEGPVKGISLHCTTTALPNANWEGLAYEKLWCPASLSVYSQALAVPVGSEIQVDFDRKGKPLSIVPIQDSKEESKERR